jgi:RNA polymerase sigma-70 factor (ECF subfamily)
MSITATLPWDWAAPYRNAMTSLTVRPRGERPAVAVDPAPPSDEACMSAYGRGDAGAFQTLYQRYHKKLYRYLLRLSPVAEEAEEVFQEVWIAIIRGRERYESSGTFAAWLFSIAHRRAADRWRELGRHAPDAYHRSDEDEAEIEALLPAVAQTPDRHADNDALGKALLDAVASLPLPQREAFLMRAEGGLGVEAIAAATGVSRETAKSRLRYAQQKLRESLEGWR